MIRIEAVELRRIEMPLVRAFRTSFGTQTWRDVLLVRILANDTEGWGECVALEAPVYSSEYVDGAQHVLAAHLLPRLLAGGGVTADAVAPALAAFHGHRMAKAALEMAVLDAELRAEGRSFAQRLGAVRNRVACGVSVGIAEDIPALLEEVEGYVAEGYARIKLKIEPGWDVEPVRAVRERFGPGLLLQVDANAAYRLDDAEHLAALDAFGLLLIEQPLPEERVAAHAALARRLRTPLCLDESILSAEGAVDAIELGACAVVNIKAGRVGGYLEAERIAKACAARDVPVWCGGMVETGLGRAANLALAALPHFTLPGDTSGSRRFYATDLTEPFVLAPDGTLPVPEGPGLGVTPLPDVLRDVTRSVQLVRAP